MGADLRDGRRISVCGLTGCGNWLGASRPSSQHLRACQSGRGCRHHLYHCVKDRPGRQVRAGSRLCVGAKGAPRGGMCMRGLGLCWCEEHVTTVVGCSPSLSTTPSDHRLACSATIHHHNHHSHHHHHDCSCVNNRMSRSLVCCNHRQDAESTSATAATTTTAATSTAAKPCRCRSFLLVLRTHTQRSGPRPRLFLLQA